MGVAQLSRVTVIAPRSDYQDVLTSLARFDEFHLVKDRAAAAASFDPATEELAVRAVRLSAQVDQLVRDLAIPLVPGAIDFVFRGAKVPETKYDAKDWESLLSKAEQEAEPILSRIREEVNKLIQLQKLESDTAELVATLQTISNISTDLGLASRLKRLRVFLAVADRKIVPELQNSLTDVIFFSQPVGQERALVFIASVASEFSKVDKAVRVFELKPLVLPANLPQSPAEAYKKLSEDLRVVSLERAETEQEIENLKEENAEKLLALREIAQSASAVLDEVRASGGLKRMAIASGYIPSKRDGEFAKDFGGWIISIDHPPPSHEQADEPTLFTNHGLPKAFEKITENQGIPGWAEVDPTPLVTLVFPIFYGMMFGDLGHGLVVTAFSLLLMTRHNANIRTWGRIFFTAGISASVFGALFGEFFGFPLGLRQFVPALPPQLELVNRLGTQPTLDIASVDALLVLTLLIGLTHLLVAMSLGILKTTREHKKMELVLEKIPSFVMYVSGVLFALSFIGAGFSFPRIYTTTDPVPLLGIQTSTLGIVSTVVVLGSVLVIALGKGIAAVAGKWHETSVSDAFINGVVEILVKIAEFLSNTISYARLAILLFVHAALLIAVNLLFANYPFYVAIFPAIVFNVMIILLEGLIVYIQDLRLHLYEFFTKFYEGTGTPFKKLLPERMRTKINWG